MVQRNGIFRDTTQTHAAIEEYHGIAERYGMSIAQMTLAWVYQYDGVASTIIGATTMRQLKENLAAYELVLSAEVLSEIDQTIKRFPVPF